MPAYYDEEEGFGPASIGRERPRSNLPVLAGVVAIVAVAGGGFWFLGSGGPADDGPVPVITAEDDGPIKTAPENAGGELTPHTDVAAYDASDDAIGETRLGDAPAAPAEEDLPRRDLAAATDGGAVGRAPAEALDESGVSAGPSAATLSYSQPARPASARDTGIDIVALDDGEVFVPQGLSQPRMPRLITSEAELLNSRRPAPRLVSTQEAPVPARGESSELAPPVSPLVRLRPDALATRFAETEAEDAAAEQHAALVRAAERSEVQIQLGAYPEREKIEAEWARLQGENTDILSGRALAVQQTISGGITYYRLRVGPFRSPQEASTVCQALKARGYDCLLAINTESRG